MQQSAVWLTFHIFPSYLRRWVTRWVESETEGARLRAGQIFNQSNEEMDLKLDFQGDIFKALKS